MREAGKLLVAVLVGAAIALGGVALADDGPAGGQLDRELRVIAEGRFEDALLDMHTAYGQLLEEEFGIQLPPREGPEPCAGIGDEDLRSVCVDGLSTD